MTVHYSLTRFEILRTYFFILPRSPRVLTVVLIISAWPAFTYLSSKGAFSRTLTLTDFLFAFLWMIGGFFLLLFWVFIRAKTKERMLSISDKGIYTEIGRIKADYPWRKVKEIKDVGRYVVIVNRSGNAFFIPSRAFADEEQRIEFLAKLNEWCPRG